LSTRGVWIIVVGRFIPGGRTATTYVAGTVEMPWKRRFLPADVIAAGLWGLYASALGYVGGRSFENNVWLPMLIGAGASLLVGGIGELVRRKLLDRGGEEKDGRHAPGSTDAARAEEEAQGRASAPQRAPGALAAAKVEAARPTLRDSTG
jgi:membrane-associated protein